MQRQLARIGMVVLAAIGTMVWCHDGLAEVTIDWATVDDAGNSADGTGYGALAYEYRISKYEVSNGQYIEFLNAVAATDTYNLYNTSMGSDLAGGIARSGSPGSYTYSARDGDTNWLSRPVSHVSWYDCLRFANWLHNGQPTGAQNSSTTEDGAYTFSGETTVGARNAGARVWLANENEWYKAAYYKGGGTSAGYWDYPMQSDAVPTNDAPPGGANSANFADVLTGGTGAVGAPYYTTVIGAYSSSPSAYGTFDQGGNQWEWTETDDGGNKVQRGGSWYNDETLIVSSFRLVYGPADELNIRCFRVAALAEATELEWVTVGDPGNNDDGTGYGAVGYTYQIGKYEVTCSQYADFLNAVAATDTYNLYNTGMGSEDIGGITRSGSAGSYTYAVKVTHINRPATHVSWYDCLRFANWLHNEQPTGAQDSTTTEDGAYTFSGETTVGARNSGARVWLANEDEWYKAAYYKGGGTSAGYWDYPTGSDTAPTNDLPPGSGNSANCAIPNASGYVLGPPYYTTDVGAYTTSPSPYGTFDQGGNQWEWTETDDGGSKVQRGGGWYNDTTFIVSSFRLVYGPADEANLRGFRVAQPGSIGTMFMVR